MATYIIAEIGVNHNGSMDLAKNSIDAAVQTGANAVKFQLFKAKEIVVKNASKANYQKINTDSEETQLEMLQRLELTNIEIAELKKYSKTLGIDFICSPFDIASVKELYKMGLKIFKLGSGEITNIPLLQEIDKLNIHLILSTGMSNYSEVEEALHYLKNTKVTLLHCTSNYPCDFVDVNLSAMKNMGVAFQKDYGYSDHTLGNEVSIGAVVLGAKILEKHFTLDKNLKGPDHKASLDPKEFSEFVRQIRNIELALGDGIKKCMPSELNTRDVARKSIVVNTNLLKGERITKDNISLKRPGNGLHPRYFSKIIGKRVNKNLIMDHKLDWNDFDDV